MRKYVDYIREHESEEARVEMRCKELLSANTPEKIQLLEKIIITDLNQYRIHKDEVRRARVEQRYYPALCELAKIQGGRVELNIDETYYYASLTYIGKELILDGSYPPEIIQFVQIIQDADTFTIMQETTFFKLQATFEMTRKELIVDNTEKLSTLKSAYRNLC